jgi:hypothetical protein
MLLKLKQWVLNIQANRIFWIQVDIKYPCYSLVRTDKSLIHYGIMK